MFLHKYKNIRTLKKKKKKTLPYKRKLGPNDLGHGWNGFRGQSSKSRRIFLSKFVLGTIREGQFLYNSIVQITNTIFDWYSAFSLYFSIPFFQGPPSNLYYLPFLIFTLHVDSKSLMLILVPSASFWSLRG